MARLSGVRGRVLVGLLVLVNVALIGYAVHHHANPTAQPQPPVPTNSPHPKPSVKFVPANASRAVGRPPSGLFSAASTKVAWRAHGGCTGTPAFGGTRDGGLTFTDLTPPDSYVLSLHLTTVSTGWMVGADLQCQPAYFATRNGGETWRVVSSLNNAWTIFGSKILTPDGRTAKAPCAFRPANQPYVIAGAGNNRAVVICRRGIVRTTDQGSSWRPAGKIPPGRPDAIAFTSRGRGLLALARSSQCPGIRIALTRDAGASWTLGPCLDAARPPLLASVASSGAGLLVSPGYFFRTANFGTTWS